MNEQFVRIRRLTPGDDGEIVRAAALFDNPPMAEAARSYLEDARNVFLLAEEDDRPVGFLRGTELGQLETGRKQMFLYEISVAAPFRRRGVGRELVNWLLRYCRERDFAEVFVFTDPENVPAVRLYQSTGGVAETSADRMYVYQLEAKETPAPDHEFES